MVGKPTSPDDPEPPILGDMPISPEYEAQMQQLARGIDGFFNGEATGDDRKTGFVLLVFPFGDGGGINFISNGADREDIVLLFREMITRFEGMAGGVGHG